VYGPHDSDGWSLSGCGRRTCREGEGCLDVTDSCAIGLSGSNSVTIDVVDEAAGTFSIDVSSSADFGCSIFVKRDEAEALREMLNRVLGQKPNEAARVQQLETVCRSLLRMAAGREYGRRVGWHLAEHLEWPEGSPDAVHVALEEARAVLAGEPST